jgi:hypothetical protein
MSRTPEGDVKAGIKKFLDRAGAYYHMSVQTGYGRRTVDFLVCWRGQFLAVEAKRAGGAARRYQDIILQQVRDSGGLAVCVDDVDELRVFLSGALSPCGMTLSET